jgi:hypothetical protein
MFIPPYAAVFANDTMIDPLKQPIENHVTQGRVVKVSHIFALECRSPETRWLLANGL